jgi:hypothetical protein
MSAELQRDRWSLSANTPGGPRQACAGEVPSRCGLRGWSAGSAPSARPVGKAQGGWDIIGADIDPRPGVDRGELPGHRHGARVGGVIGDELHGLQQPHAWDEFDEADLDDVRVGGGLASRG